MKKVLAIILALALTAGCIVFLASCGNKTTEPETTAMTEAPVEGSSEDVSAPEEGDSTEAAPAEETTEAAETTTEATTAETTTEETTEAKKAPEGKEEILKVYNDAVNNAISKKAGYSKTRVTNINSLEGGKILDFQVVKDAVNDFLGVGTKNYTNSKGKAEYMGKASLSASDVSNATCTEKDGKYTIELTVNNGSSSASGSGKSDNSAINKTGLFVGSGDKSEFDYKSAGNIYDALNGLDEASVQAVSVSTNSIKITAVVDAESGNLENLKVTFNFTADLTSVKYLIVTVKSATGRANTTVTYKDFKY